MAGGLDLEMHAMEFCGNIYYLSSYECFFSDAEGVKDVDAKWIGWAGVNVPDEVGQRALTKALAEKVGCNSMLSGSIEQ